MTYPLIAFALWLLSTSTLPVGNPADQFIATNGVQDPTTKALLEKAGQKMASDPSFQMSLVNGRQGFSGWLGYFGSEANSAYPKNCRVYTYQVSAIANLPATTPLNAKLNKAEVATNDMPETPYEGIALALLTMSLPTLDHAQLCNQYMCEEACKTDIFLQLLLLGLKNPALQGSVDMIRDFYQQYTQVLQGLNVNTDSFPPGWTCVIKNDLHINSADSIHHTR
jgi:hypothetical protein